MHKGRVAFLLAVTVVSLAIVACDDGAAGYGPNDPPIRSHLLTPTPDAVLNLYGTQAAANLQADYAAQTAVALKETAVAADAAVTQQAQATIEARRQWAFEVTQTAVARLRLAEEAQATRAAVIEGTETAIAYAQATATAQARATAQAEARAATRTARAVQATRTAEARSATTTVQAHRDGLEATRVEATAQAVARLDQRERSTQAFRTYSPWALLLLVIPGVAWLGWRAAKIVEDRARVIRRRANEGEPFVLLEQTDEHGNRRIALPLRSFNSLLDTGQVPALPPPHLQDRAAARQQLANVVQAALGPGHKTRRKRRLRKTSPRLPTPEAGQRPAPGIIQVLPPEKVRPWIEDVEGQLMEEIEE